MIAALAAILGAAALAGAPGPNLVVNPSCEAHGEQDLTSPPGWMRWTEAGWAGRLSVDPQAGRIFGPARSARALRAEHVGSRGGWVSTAAVPVRDDRRYVLAGFVSADRAAGEARIGVRFMGEDGLLGEAFTPAVSGSTGAGEGDWIPVAVEFRPPEGTTQATVQCRADWLVGTAWFDDLTLRELPGAEPSAAALRARALAALGAAPAAVPGALGGAPALRRAARRGRRPARPGRRRAPRPARRARARAAPRRRAPRRAARAA